jgi:hypothetical protein
VHTAYFIIPSLKPVSTGFLPECSPHFSPSPDVGSECATAQEKSSCSSFAGATDGV